MLHLAGNQPTSDCGAGGSIVFGAVGYFLKS